MGKKKKVMGKKKNAEFKDEELYLKDDLVIPKGTRFENLSNQAKEGQYYESIWGHQVHMDFACWMRIPKNYMDEIKRLNPEFFTDQAIAEN